MPCGVLRSCLAMQEACHEQGAEDGACLVGVVPILLSACMGGVVGEVVSKDSTVSGN